MPQVNSSSWTYTSLKLMMIFVTMMLAFSYIEPFSQKKINKKVIWSFVLL